MEIKHLSASAIELFRTCPYKYKRRVEKTLPETSNVYLIFGEYVHEALEQFYKETPCGSELGSCERLIDIYNELKNKYMIRLASVGEKYDEGIDILNKYYNYYIRKNIISSAKLIEHKFKINIGPVKIVGKIDRIDKDSNGLRVIDYKTGQIKKTEIDDDIQLSIYTIAAFDEYPKEEEVQIAWHYLKHKNVDMKRTKKDVEPITKNIINIYNEMIGEKEFKPKKNIYCNYCEIKKECSLYKEGACRLNIIL